MLLASTSSAYGANTHMPYTETDKSDHQLSFYAATKKATENMAHSYAHLFDLPVTMFRFFTVYGPWGRPDMALFKFTKAILEGKPIDVYNYGNMKRDFTYVEDLVEGIRLLIDAVPVRPEGGIVPEGDSLSPVAPWRIVNIGNSEAVQLTDFISAIEEATGRKAEQNLMPIQAGDVPATWASADLLQALTGYRPKTSVREGVARFVQMVPGLLPDLNLGQAAQLAGSWQTSTQVAPVISAICCGLMRTAALVAPAAGMTSSKSFSDTSQ